MYMKCGKFKGCVISGQPADYLEWLASLPELNEPLKTAPAFHVRNL